MIKNKILLLLIATLAGCGGGDSSPSTSTNKQVEEEGIDNTPSYLLQAQDSFAVVKPYQEAVVSVAEYIPSNAKITNVINESGDPLCDVTEITNTSFNVKINALMPCRYSYQVQTDATAVSDYAEVLTSKAPLKSAANGARIAESAYQAAITVLTSTSDNSLLPPIAIATISNVTSSIDLKAHLQSYYPNGYVLQDGPILAGNGEIISIDKTQQSIMFKAGAEGMSRITYTLKGTNAEGEEDLNLGVIDIATSDTANQPPIANSFTFVNELMVNSAAVEIDVTKYISANGDTDNLQLVYVSSLTATVASSYPNNLTNKIFSFAASTPGTHVVTYGISDHRGGYAIGVVYVNVSGLDYSQWNSLFYNGNMFTAPLTALEASAMGVTATSLTDFKERTYTPSIPMATFNYTDAKNYCERVHKGRLPIIEELHYFFQQTDSNGNPDKDKQPHKLKEGHWPTSANYYIAYSSDEFLNDTIVRLHRPNSGTNRPYDEVATGQTSFYVTCVVPLNVTFTTTVANNYSTANDTALIHVDVKVVDSMGIAASNSGKISIEVLASEGVTMTTDASQVVSASGNRFSFRSTKATTIPLKVDYNGNPFLTNITFVADRTTSRIAELRILRNEMPAGDWYRDPNGDVYDTSNYTFYHLRNSVNITILDAYNNPVPNLDVWVYGGNKEGAEFFAYQPGRNTDSYGRLIDYPIGLPRLSSGVLTEDNTLTVTPKVPITHTDRIASVVLTNTLPEASPWATVWFTHPVRVSEVETVLPQGSYTSIEHNGISYALMDHATGLNYCKTLDKYNLPQSHWTLPNNEMFDVTWRKSDQFKALGWPIGRYWTSNAQGDRFFYFDAATGEANLPYGGHNEVKKFIICANFTYD